MSAPKKHMLDSERSFLLALSNEIQPFLLGLNYREARACGLSGSQLYAIKRGEPINLTILTLRRLVVAMGIPFAKLVDSAEAKTHR